MAVAKGLPLQAQLCKTREPGVGEEGRKGHSPVHCEPLPDLLTVTAGEGRPYPLPSGLSAIVPPGKKAEGGPPWKADALQMKPSQEAQEPAGHLPNIQ